MFLQTRARSRRLVVELIEARLEDGEAVLHVLARLGRKGQVFVRREEGLVARQDEVNIGRAQLS
jgi:hypothetical protein